MSNLIDSNVDLFMYLIKGIGFGTWKVRRLNWALVTLQIEKTTFPFYTLPLSSILKGKNPCCSHNNAMFGWHTCRRRRLNDFWWVVGAKSILVLVLLKATFPQTTWNFIFEVLTTTRARSSKSFTLCLYMKTIRTKLAKVQFAYFVQRDQHGIIAKDLT